MSIPKHINTSNIINVNIQSDMLRQLHCQEINIKTVKQSLRVNHLKKCLSVIYQLFVPSSEP